jgi:hypothetical protein
MKSLSKYTNSILTGKGFPIYEYAGKTVLKL